MESGEIEFYLRHRAQITEWAKLRERVAGLMRDAVSQGSQDGAARLLDGETGDLEVDFYMRNRVAISEWDALRGPAGLALHEALLSAARDRGCEAGERKRGWTEVRMVRPEFTDFLAGHALDIQMAWAKQDLLTTQRGYPFPRIALVLNPNRWKGVSRENLIAATRGPAHELGMKKHDAWWAFWRMLDGISDSEALRAYSERCVDSLQEATDAIFPTLRDAVQAEARGSDAACALPEEPHG